MCRAAERRLRAANGRARGAADGRRRAADGRARGAAVGRLRAADGRAPGAAVGRLKYQYQSNQSCSALGRFSHQTVFAFFAPVSPSPSVIVELIISVEPLLAQTAIEEGTIEHIQ